jgi:hypothetical protein
MSYLDWYLNIIHDENERAAYVDNIILKSDRSNIAKLRICTHNLEIEKSRYFQINRTERFCNICNDLEIEDENHFLWQCEKYRKEREILFKKVSLYYKKFPNFNNDTMKSKLLLNSKSVRINKLCTDFISNLLKIRKDSIS